MNLIDLKETNRKRFEFQLENRFKLKDCLTFGNNCLTNP